MRYQSSLKKLDILFNYQKFVKNGNISKQSFYGEREIIGSAHFEIIFNYLSYFIICILILIKIIQSNLKVLRLVEIMQTAFNFEPNQISVNRHTAQ